MGIKQPIYATLSDIVIYSPKGLTRASMALAERFKVAIEKKAGERREKMRGSSSNGASEGDELIAYNVFVLDANASEMVQQVPHLIMKLQSPRVRVDCAEKEEDGEGEGEKEGTGLRANTIDFALREKEEMRDLTKASEIISVGSLGSGNGGGGGGAVVGKGGEATVPIDLSGSTTASHWDPTIGQIFLGNSNDVPLVPDPLKPSTHPTNTTTHTPSRILHAINNSDMELYADEPPHPHTNGDGDGDGDDPFTYKATNDPQRGYGYDICVECHEMAPFPSTAHLRAADEHLQ